jgi:hypothetical protein
VEANLFDNPPAVLIRVAARNPDSFESLENACCQKNRLRGCHGVSLRDSGVNDRLHCEGGSE